MVFFFLASFLQYVAIGSTVNANYCEDECLVLIFTSDALACDRLHSTDNKGFGAKAILAAWLRTPAFW